MSEKVKSYRELLVWQKGVELVEDVYIANRLEYLTLEKLNRLDGQIEELRKMIRGLLSKLTTGHWPLTTEKKLATHHSPPITKRGFTLVELLIAMAVASVVGLAGYVIFSTSNWSYKVQEDVSEAQQNVRVAMDRLAKDIRTAGFGLPDPPFSLTFSNLSTTPPTLPNPLTAPIDVTDSSTGNDTITILGIGYEAGTLLKGGSTDCNDSGRGKICLDSVASANSFFTGSGPYTYQPNRRYISLNGTTFIELANTQTDTDRSAGKLALGSPATLDRNYPDGTPVYIIQAVQYTIATDLTGCSTSNPCLVSRDYTMLRGGSTPGARQVFAENIEDIQFAYGIDASPRDGKIDSNGTDYRFDSAGETITDPSSIIAVRANIVAKTRNQDTRAGNVFRRPALEDRAQGDTDGYRRRVLTKVIKLRNPRQGA